MLNSFEGMEGALPASPIVSTIMWVLFAVWCLKTYLDSKD